MPTVSTPVSWKEVEAALKESDTERLRFTPHEVLARVEKQGDLFSDVQTLKQTLWNYVGLIKTDARLKRAEGILTELSGGIDVFYRKAALSDELIGLRHASLAARLILEACKRNSKSLGCYLREELEI